MESDNGKINGKIVAFTTKEHTIRCTLCEPYGEVFRDIPDYKTKAVFCYNDKPMIAICSNGHVFSLWNGEE